MTRLVTLVVLNSAALGAVLRARTAAARGRMGALRARPRQLPGALRAPLAEALDRAAFDITPEAALQVWAIGTAAVALVAIAVVAPLAPVIVTFAAISPIALIRTARARGDRRAEAALPEIVRSIAADLRSGGTVRTALDRISGVSGPLRADFGRIAARMGLGGSLESALEPWPRERPIAGIGALAGALAVAAELGGAAARPLEGLASSLADRLGISAETRAQSAQARVSAVVVGAAPIGYLVLSAAMDREAIGSIISRPLGRACLGLGIALDLLAVVWMRRIVGSQDATW